MRRYVLGVALVLGSTLVAQEASAELWTGNINALIGQKTLEEDDWAPVEEQGMFAVNLDFREESWPVSIAIGMLGSDDEGLVDGVQLEGSTRELHLGVRKNFHATSTFRPFIGGGVTLVNADIEAFDADSFGSDSDGAVGYWLSGGAYWTLGRSFNLGFEVGHSEAEVDLFGVKGEAGGTHAGMLFGYHW